MINRELDAEICKVIFDWRYIDVSADADGNNACQILFYPNVDAEQCYYDALPKKGRPHEGFFCPRYTSELDTAIRLAYHVGLDLTLSRLPLEPEVISMLALAWWHKQRDDRFVPVYAVYKNPVDYPHHFTVRRHIVLSESSGPVPDKFLTYISEDLEDVRLKLHVFGLINVGRMYGDDVKIVESWI